MIFIKVAIIGSRNLTIRSLDKYLPENIDEIISGGAIGIDTCAKEYAINNRIKLTEFLPNYDLYGKTAPLKRNLEIIKHADCVIAFWDGNSNGTRYVIKKCRELGKKVTVYMKKT